MTEHTFKFQPEWQSGGYLPEHIGRLNFGSHTLRLFFGKEGLGIVIPRSFLKSDRCHIVEDGGEATMSGLGSFVKLPSE